jgi:hypothetical protein
MEGGPAALTEYACLRHDEGTRPPVAVYQYYHDDIHDVIFMYVRRN